MIVAEFKGGLGNQMFQYAAAKSLSKHLSTSLKFDTRHYQDPDSRPFIIKELFGLKEPEASDRELNKLDPRGRTFLSRVQRRVKHSLPVFLNPKFVEPSFLYTPQFFSVPRNVYVQGYWQSEKYFKEIEREIRDVFKLRPELNEMERGWLERIEKSISVAIHVRRGDYVSNPTYNAFHGLMPLTYYQKGVEMLEKKFGELEFFVFSDDKDWVEKEFKMNHTIIHGSNEIVDLYLMTKCRHNIIANSSFSWWGAWLGDQNDKMVIAPKLWFADPTSNALTLDMIPKEWNRI